MESFSNAFKLLQEKIASWGKEAILLLPNLLISLFILLIAYMAGVYLGRAASSILRRFLKNISLINFLSALTRLTTILVGLIIALYVLRLDRAVLSILTGVGILGIALGFAFQDMAANFISGIALVFHDDRPFKVGDIVETNGQMGKVREINLRTSMIETFQGHSVFVPNKQIFQAPVINYSFRGRRRIDLAVGVSYGDDLEKVKGVTLAAVKDIPRAEHPDLFFEEFGSSSINLIVRFWIPFIHQTDFLAARSEAIVRIKKVYDENGITIPFPIRTLDFGIKGGEKLSAVLVNAGKGPQQKQKASQGPGPDPNGGVS
ncbi:MAG: mechanosensitive ion channel family protein [Deltaproteobacteria bacterium]|jgi:small conductance mechanosensitive channel